MLSNGGGHVCSSTVGFQNAGLGICSPNNAQQRKVLFVASNTTSIWLLGNRTVLLCVVLKDMVCILVEQVPHGWLIYPVDQPADRMHNDGKLSDVYFGVCLTKWEASKIVTVIA